MNSENYKLHYFGGNGRASISRAILSIGAPNFENVIIGMEKNTLKALPLIFI